MLKDLFYFIIEALMMVGVTILNGLGSLMSGLDISPFFSALTAETLSIMTQIGISQALGMIVTCLGIRFILQMIPFVRWGS
jgi:hypothetical protein